MCVHVYQIFVASFVGKWLAVICHCMKRSHRWWGEIIVLKETSQALIFCLYLIASLSFHLERAFCAIAMAFKFSRGSNAEHEGFALAAAKKTHRTTFNHETGS